MEEGGGGMMFGERGEIERVSGQGFHLSSDRVRTQRLRVASGDDELLPVNSLALSSEQHQ